MQAVERMLAISSSSSSTPRTGPFDPFRLQSYTAFGMWWHTVTHGRGNEGETGEWRGVTSTLTPPRQVVYPATLMRTPRLPAVDWTDYSADLNGLVRLGGRQNVVSARVPSGSARVLQLLPPTFLWSSNCSPSLLSVVVWFQRDSVLYVWFM